MSDKPNVLVIMTDQQRYDTIGALGNSLIQTPALDRLVTGGTSFITIFPSLRRCPIGCTIRPGQVTAHWIFWNGVITSVHFFCG